MGVRQLTEVELVNLKISLEREERKRLERESSRKINSPVSTPPVVEDVVSSVVSDQNSEAIQEPVKVEETSAGTHQTEEVVQESPKAFRKKRF